MDLRVLLGNVPVGKLERHQHGKTVFRFDEAYLTLPERPVLGRWFEDHLEPNFEYAEQGNRLPPFFQNYLAEQDSGLRVLLARRAGVDRREELPLLAALGEDLPGAIVVHAEDALAPDIEGDEPSPGSPRSDEHALRFSLAGMQLKFSVMRHDDRFTLPVTGAGGRWIAKLPDRRFPRVPENEFSILSWAREVGISVPEFKLVDVSDIAGLPAELHFSEPKSLVVRRFDRSEDGARIHQEDFAQVLNVRPSKKYEGFGYATIAKIVRTICGEADYHEFMRRLAFVVISGNADAHLKNWSLVYPDGRRPRLSPAYDLVFTIGYPDTDRRLGLQLSREKDFSRVTRKHFERLAAKIGESPERAGEIASETAARAREAWDHLGQSLPLAPELRHALDRYITTVAF
jgi:serine/threonine-protein kinase HipA